MPICLKDIHFTFAPGTSWARPVLRGIDLEVAPGECLGILGANGSGKSTLIRHMNGLLRQQRGTVTVGETTLGPGEERTRILAREVGLVFQFPEKQLFAETVFDDVASGLIFAEAPLQEIGDRVAAALERVGMDPGEYADRSPFSLTWGEKRKAALAGVLALDAPRFVFDEPGAGLDPRGRRMLHELIADLVRSEGKTVVIVSHHLDDLFRVADRFAILDNGRIAFHGSLEDLCRQDLLTGKDLQWPSLIRLMRTIARHRSDLPTSVRTPEEAARILRPIVSGGQGPPPGPS